jgi:hypothetical protein
MIEELQYIRFTTVDPLAGEVHQVLEVLFGAEGPDNPGYAVGYA